MAQYRIVDSAIMPRLDLRLADRLLHGLEHADDHMVFAQDAIGLVAGQVAEPARPARR